MIIRYISDIHLEFGVNSRFMDVYGLAEGGDVLLVAGDAGYLGRRRTESRPFFDWCSRHFAETVIVPGNHEYYRDPFARDGRQDGMDVADTLVNYERLLRPNARYLNNRSLRLGDVEVFATTLWSAVPKELWTAVENGMNDCQQIRYKGHLLRASDFTEIHGICRGWLDDALRKSQAPLKIVLTHHCPTIRREFDRYAPSSPLYSAFHANMEDFIAGHSIDVWVYGHTHWNGGSGTVFPSEKETGTILLCNQLGYMLYNEDKNGYRRDAFFEM